MLYLNMEVLVKNSEPETNWYASHVFLFLDKNGLLFSTIGMLARIVIWTVPTTNM